MTLPSDWSTQQIWDQAEHAADYAAARYREAILYDYEAMLTDHALGSPLEAIFLAWWMAYQTAERRDGIWSLDLEPQFVVVCGPRQYRLDFCVSYGDTDLLGSYRELGWAIPAIGIELDGHAFHERTKEQVDTRNRRDRDLAQRGWRMFHFSGSEVVRDPLKCVLEVYEYTWTLYDHLWSQWFDHNRTTRSG